MKLCSVDMRNAILGVDLNNTKLTGADLRDSAEPPSLLKKKKVFEKNTFHLKEFCTHILKAIVL